MTLDEFKKKYGIEGASTVLYNLLNGSRFSETGFSQSQDQEIREIADDLQSMLESSEGEKENWGKTGQPGIDDRFNPDDPLRTSATGREVLSEHHLWDEFEEQINRTGLY